MSRIRRGGALSRSATGDDRPDVGPRIRRGVLEQHRLVPAHLGVGVVVRRCDHDVVHNDVCAVLPGASVTVEYLADWRSSGQL